MHHPIIRCFFSCRRKWWNNPPPTEKPFQPITPFVSSDRGNGIVSDIVLVELCGTLARSYELSRADIARTVHALLDNASIALESPTAVKSALVYFEAGSADFPDCLIVAKAGQVGCSHTLGFDKRMGLLPGVELL
jgi:predicted nucleic-acid-binding protein